MGYLTKCRMKSVEILKISMLMLVSDKGVIKNLERLQSSPAARQSIGYKKESSVEHLRISKFRPASVSQNSPRVSTALAHIYRNVNTALVAKNDPTPLHVPSSSFFQSIFGSEIDTATKDYNYIHGLWGKLWIRETINSLLFQHFVTIENPLSYLYTSPEILRFLKAYSANLKALKIRPLRADLPFDQTHITYVSTNALRAFPELIHRQTNNDFRYHGYSNPISNNYGSSNPCVSEDAYIQVIAHPQEIVASADIPGTNHAHGNEPPEAAIVLKTASECAAGDELPGGFIIKGIVISCLEDHEVLEIHGLIITPYHPIFVDDSWHFPIDISDRTFQLRCRMVNFLLDRKPETSKDAEPYFIANDIRCIALGHNNQKDPVLRHPFLGDDNAVCSALEKLQAGEGGQYRNVRGVKEEHPAGINVISTFDQVAELSEGCIE